MIDHIVFLALGLGNGAVYAALGLALVLTYRSSGVVNFATGAVALYVAYTYAFLRKGELLNPIPGLPGTVSLSGPWGMVPAMVAAFAVAALLGAVLYIVVFRPLRAAPPVAKAVASIGVMLTLQALLALQVGTSPVSVSPVLPTGSLVLGDVRLPLDRLCFAVTVLVLAAVLVAFFRWTRFGLATRAVAESEKGSLVTGLSPDRIALGNWALSTVTAGIAGILIAPIVPLVPASYTLFIVPALAAALTGNFTAIGVTVVAGLGIGMVQSELTHLQTTVSWLPGSGTAELVPLVLLLVVLLVRGRPLPSRGALVQQTLGRAPRPRGLVVPTLVGTGVGVLALVLTTGSYRAAVVTSLVFGVIALSQVVVTGFAGQISLAQLALAGVSAFTLSRLTTQLGVPFPIAPLLAALAAAVVGVVVGLPALRIRGLPVAVVTLALAVFLEAFWFLNSSFNGGMTGSSVASPSLFGIDLGVGAGEDYPRLSFGLVCLVVLVVTAVVVAKLRSSRLGAAMLALRANERSAAAAGIDVARTKIVAFAIGAFIAGLGGALLAYQQTLAAASSYSALAGIALFTIVYIAGITCVSGGVLAGVIAAGGIVFVIMDRVLHLGSYYAIISGILLVLTVVKYPEGLIGHAHELTARARRLLGRDRGSVSESAGVAVEPPVSPIEKRSPDGEVVLRARNLGVRFGGVVAVDDVSFDVHSGEILGLIGPNGAGKTTCIDALSGFADATGTVTLGEHRIDSLPPHRRSRAGLGRTFQGIELYDDLSVRENISVGSMSGSAGADGDDVAALFGVLGLDALSDRPVGELSQGQRQLVSVARAMAGRPTVLLLDEPAAGLDTAESRRLGERLMQVRDSGVSIVLVDHDMDLVLDICDRVVVLDLGAVIADDVPERVRSNPAVVQAYLGTSDPSTEALA